MGAPPRTMASTAAGSRVFARPTEAAGELSERHLDLRRYCSARIRRYWICALRAGGSRKSEILAQLSRARCTIAAIDNNVATLEPSGCREYAPSHARRGNNHGHHVALVGLQRVSEAPARTQYRSSIPNRPFTSSASRAVATNPVRPRSCCRNGYLLLDPRAV